MLQLKNYFYPHIVIKADPDYKLGKKAEFSAKLNVEINIRQISAENRSWEVCLNLKGIPEKDPIPYHFDLEIVGMFNVAPEVPEKQIEALVQLAGCSMLYSAAREFVLMLTSRGPFPPVTLPTISFQQEKKAIKDTKPARQVKEPEAEKK